MCRNMMLSSVKMRMKVMCLGKEVVVFVGM